MANEKGLTMAASVGKNFANVYVSEYFEEIDRTIVTVFFEDKGVEYKHFTFVLGTGKTRMVLSDIVEGTYEVHATQISRNGDTAEGTVRFDYKEIAFDLIDELQRLSDSLKH